MTEHEFLQHLSERCAEWLPPGQPVVVAVSGGPDSVALLRGLAAVAGKETSLAVAHLNHQIRAQDADRDERFVADLARDLGLRLNAGRIDVEAEANRRAQSLETTARDLRYQFLRETAEALQARFVALGHTADDQAETILHRVVRGTGLRGLAGMPARRKLGRNCELIRPLLNLARRDVLDYLSRIGQPYCHDATNDSSSHTRNRLRNELLPRLEREYNPRTREALLRLGQLADEAQQVIDASVRERLERADLIQWESGCSLLAEPLVGAETHVLRTVFVRLWQKMGWGLRELGFEALDRVASVLQNGITATTLPGNIDVRRRGRRIELTRRAIPDATPDDTQLLRAL